MRNLLLFLIRFNYVFVFLIVETVSLIFVIRNHAYQKTGFLNSAGFVTGNIYQSYFQVSEYLNLRVVNEELMKENALLRKGIVPQENIPVYDECADPATVNYYFIPVKVINYTTSKSTNYITLNKGKSSGIEKDMGLITGTGVIGIVNRSSENFATAMSVLHKDCRISVKVKRFNYPCTVQWTGGSPYEAELTGIAQHVSINAGDSIVTSGFSAIFPENIPVGVIKEFKLSQGSSFYAVKITLSSSPDNLQYAYVVNNIYQNEQRELELQND